MRVVASETSPLNCRWITWNDKRPVCTRPPDPPHRVCEHECAVFDHWNEDVDAAAARPAIPGAAAHPRPAPSTRQDPLSQEACPRCGSHDVVLMQRDAVVQSFACSICHQRWLATRPWPVLGDGGVH